MARKEGPTPEDIEFSSQRGSARSGLNFYAGREFDDDEAIDAARLNDDPDQESPFLRAQKRVPVRRGPIPKKTANKLKIALLSLLFIIVLGAIGFAVYYYLTTSWRFRLDSSDSIQVSGNENVNKDDVEAVFGGDITRNIFKISLDERRQSIEQIPWVESATVMRHLSNRISVAIKERTPVAFVQMDTGIALIDPNGVVMEPPKGGQYSFPVLTGFSAMEPLSTRASRVKLYLTIIKELDGDGKNYSRDISDVDLTNPKDIRIAVGDGSVIIHTAPKDVQEHQGKTFLEQYEDYLAILPQCRARLGTGKLDIDPRYVGQIPCKPIVDPAVQQATSDAQQVTQAKPEKPQAAISKPKKPATKPTTSKQKKKH